VGGAEGAAEPWWSAAIGIVYGSRTGTVAVGGFGEIV
jgi:hypothetical protein